MRRLGIVNRGEAARRAIRAAREYLTPEGLPLETVALVTPGDESLPYALEANFQVALPVLEGQTAVAAFLDHDRVLAALTAAGVDAVWVGWGFVAEDPAFCDKVRAAGLMYVGPTPTAMRLAGDKIAAKRLAETVGVPVVPWSQAPVATAEHARRIAADIAYPVVLKAAAGGGGRGIRLVTTAEQMDAEFLSAKNEAAKAFGDSTMFLERCITRARHLEVQIAVDHHGCCKAFGVRDCTVQRRNQKILEEAPGPWASASLIAELEGHARRFALACGYTNLGTVEFIYDLDRDEACFMEMNTRLQVEHPVTELVYGLDLVRLQFDIALGKSIANVVSSPRGHAIEVRVNAEDADRDFVPSPGFVRRFDIASGPGIRVDAGLIAGNRISPDFDSMVAKVIAYGANRHEALVRLRRALRETTIIVEEGATNKSFLSLLCDHPDVVAGNVDTKWLERLQESGVWNAKPYIPEALLCAAVLAYREEGSKALASLFGQTARGVPHVLPPAQGQAIALSLRGARLSTFVYALGFGIYRVYVGAEGAVELAFDERENGLARLRLGEQNFDIVFAPGRQAFFVEVNGIGHRIERDAGGVVRAPTPALVSDICVAVGDLIQQGQRLGTLEAMKMEMSLLSPEAGKVAQILVSPNTQVSTGEPLFLLEPAQSPDSGVSAEALDVSFFCPRDLLDALVGDEDGLRSREFAALRDTQQVELAGILQQEIVRYMLGYDDDSRRFNQLEAVLGANDLWGELSCPEAFVALGDCVSTFVDSEMPFCPRRLRPHGGYHAMGMQNALWIYGRRMDLGDAGIHPQLAPILLQALAHYGVSSLEPGPILQHAFARLAISHGLGGQRAERKHRLVLLVMRVLHTLHRAGVAFLSGGDLRGGDLRGALGAMPEVVGSKYPFVIDQAFELRYVLFQRERFERRPQELAAHLDAQLALVAAGGPQRDHALDDLGKIPQSVFPYLCQVLLRGDDPRWRAAAEVAIKRRYAGGEWELGELHTTALRPGGALILGRMRGGSNVSLVAGVTDIQGAQQALVRMANETQGLRGEWVAELLLLYGAKADANEALRSIEELVAESAFGAHGRWIVVAATGSDGNPSHRTYVPEGAAWREQRNSRGIHPVDADRLELWRYREFELDRLPGHERLLVLHGVAKDNPKDDRIFVIGEVRDVPQGDTIGPGSEGVLAFEHALQEAVRTLRGIQAQRTLRSRLHWNEIILHVRTPIVFNRSRVMRMAARIGPYTQGLGLESVVVRAQVLPSGAESGPAQDIEMRLSNPTGHMMSLRVTTPTAEPIAAGSAYEMQVRAALQRGLPYPYEVVRMLTGRDTDAGTSPFEGGTFTEYDLCASPATSIPAVTSVAGRSPGQNSCSIVFGTISHKTAKHPEGMERVIILSDPLFNMGALAEPECARIIGALDLAESKRLPVEWLPVSSGARIAMDSGTENLDWTARVLRRIIAFTQAGGEINIIVDGVNVGAQSYFNAESTMLMHTRGILIMTGRGSMVLTGKKALDFSGGVSAEDERGIGGYERVMGLNGQAQYFASDLTAAFKILLQHYIFTYRHPPESRVRPNGSSMDPVTRNIGLSPYPRNEQEQFSNVGEVFSAECNGERKRPFAMRVVMDALMDSDGGALERFAEMRDADGAIVKDCHLGGHAVCLIGFESRPMTRGGYVPGDGPELWTGGTLFPQSSKKVARAINSASGNRPVVLLANLSGFDGSPESMRRLQLEYGAEIGRAVVNFKGPILFLVVGRYHGGAYVVFSKELNSGLRSIAVEGAYASVIGGGPAAAVVFPREVTTRVEADADVTELRLALRGARGSQAAQLQEHLVKVRKEKTAEKQGEVAREFDQVHTVGRAREVGSLDAVVSLAELRSRAIEELSAACR